VRFIEAGASTVTRAGIGTPDETRTASDASFDFGDGYFASTMSLPADFQMTQVRTSAAGAMSFNGVDKADLFVRAQARADALTFQPPAHGVASGTAFYYFSVDTASTLSFSAFASPANAGEQSNVTVSLFSLPGTGLPGTTYRDGWLAGSGSESYDLAAGTYGFWLTANADAATAATGADPHRVDSGAVANLSLSIVSPPAVSNAPEPAMWATMVIGFGAVGATLRSRRRSIFQHA